MAQTEEYKRRMENLAQELDSESTALKEKEGGVIQEIEEKEAERDKLADEADAKTSAAEEVRGKIESEGESSADDGA